MSNLDSLAIKARNNLFAMFSGLTILDSILVAVSGDKWAISRILIAIVVMYYVMQGKKWAKWVLIGILSLVVILLTALIVALSSKLSTFLVVGSLVLVVLDIITIVFLICSQNLNRYFASQRKENLN